MRSGLAFDVLWPFGWDCVDGLGAYGDPLVRRGEILLDLSILDGRDRDVGRMNVGERGRPLSIQAL